MRCFQSKKGSRTYAYVSANSARGILGCMLVDFGVYYTDQPEDAMGYLIVPKRTEPPVHISVHKYRYIIINQ